MTYNQEIPATGGRCCSAASIILYILLRYVYYFQFPVVKPCHPSLLSKEAQPLRSSITRRTPHYLPLHFIKLKFHLL